MKRLGRPWLLKLKTFGRTFWKSLTEPNYYQDILSAKFSFSLKYFAFLLWVIAFLLGIISAARISQLIPKVPVGVGAVKSFLAEIYPQELVLTFKDGKIKTNVKEPYAIDFPKGKDFTASYYKHFVTINTIGKVEDFLKSESMFYFTADSLVTAGVTTSYKAIPLSEPLAKIPTGSKIDKSSYINLLEKMAHYALEIMPQILVGLALVLIILYPLSRTAIELGTYLVFLLPLSLMLFVLTKILKRKIGYGKVYQFGLHAATIPVVFSFLLSSFQPYPYGMIVAWLLWVVMVVISLLRLPR